MSMVLLQPQLSTKIGLLIIEKDIVIGLSITVVIFLVLLLVGVRNTYKLKAENERLANLNFSETDEEEEKYKDFTEGHSYTNN